MTRDELRKVMKGPDRSKPAKPVKTVRVRIAVAVDASGKWHSSASGCGEGNSDEERAEWAQEFLDSNLPQAVYFVEADVPIPEPQTIEGEVKP